ncbi:DUF2785 domain-containing protein [Exiguobacterium sp. JMULE1]|uniref:DUF2785 domain-containing protein n=1 Tax=Exiguobacterium indicum TaxID=296995 RepID=A0AAW3MAJ0_9BACL|nr:MULTISPECIES: DUF2785 domain-containing protein [Exiguobacterium]KTR26080.1 hypothetical protein RSA11_11845 [Exiguobacterium indicum]NTY10397.1 DUF2785 domain-containing protein [Exiguobacterium sp. JMULE1]
MACTEQELKELLQQDASVTPALLDELLLHIGSTDSELRDGLIYPQLATYIASESFTIEDTNRIFDFILSGHGLMYRMGTADTTAVLTRSFSALALAELLVMDKTRHLLTQSQLDRLSTYLQTYLEQEKDVRGFIDGMGWAHSMAHIADVYAVWFTHPASRPQEELGAIDAMIRQLIRSDYLYVDEEADRMVTAWLQACRHGLSEDVLLQRILQRIERNIKEWLESDVTWGDAEWTTYRNVKQMLQTLYFRLKWEEQSDLVLIEEWLRQVHQRTHGG